MQQMLFCANDNLKSDFLFFILNTNLWITCFLGILNYLFFSVQHWWFGLFAWPSIFIYGFRTFLFDIENFSKFSWKHTCLWAHSAFHQRLSAAYRGVNRHSALTHTTSMSRLLLTNRKREIFTISKICSSCPQVQASFLPWLRRARVLEQCFRAPQ